MITNAMSEKMARRKAYEEIKAAGECFCGNYKMPGMGFCRECMNRLPPDRRAAMFTAGPLGWGEAYEKARNFLDEGGRARVAHTGGRGNDGCRP